MSERFTTYPHVPTPDDFAQQDVDMKAMKAALLVLMTYCNQLKAGTYVTKTPADVKNDYIAAWKSLP